LKLAFGLYDFFAFCRRLGLAMLWLLSQEMYVFVA
jgi:hypothetical protein